MYVVRPAELLEAKKLALLAEKTFKDTFADQNSAEDIKAYCERAYNEEVQAAEIMSPEYITLVVDNDGVLIAYAQLRLGDQPECVSEQPAGEIQRLYVDKSWHGKGVAHKLMAVCLETFKKYNAHGVWLGVWENNAKAQSFYKKYNFREVGEHTFILGKDIQRDIIMELSIQEHFENLSS